MVDTEQEPERRVLDRREQIHMMHIPQRVGDGADSDPIWLQRSIFQRFQ